MIDVEMIDMLLNELFGENARIKILEELLTYVDSFLTAEEISRVTAQNCHEIM